MEQEEGGDGEREQGGLEPQDQTFSAGDIKRSGQRGPSRMTMLQAARVRSINPAQTPRCLSWENWVCVFV